jgi:antitoxin ParD1/3/4
MPTRNVDLTEHFDEFIASGVQAGRFTDTSAAVHEGLDLLEQREQQDRKRSEWLVGAAQSAIESLDRGEGRSFSSRDEMAEYIYGLARKANAQFGARDRRA